MSTRPPTRGWRGLKLAACAAGLVFAALGGPVASLIAGPISQITEPDEGVDLTLEMPLSQPADYGFVPVLARMENDRETTEAWTLTFMVGAWSGVQVSSTHRVEVPPHTTATRTLLVPAPLASYAGSGAQIMLEASGPAVAGGTTGRMALYSPWLNSTEFPRVAVTDSLLAGELGTRINSAVGSTHHGLLEVATVEPGLLPADWRTWSGQNGKNSGYLPCLFCSATQ